MLDLEHTPDASDQVRRNFERIQQQWPPEPTYRGTGSPAGVITAGPGAIYVDLATGKIWVRESTGIGNVGWVMK